MNSPTLRRRARLSAAAAGMTALVSLGVATATVEAAPPRSGIPQISQASLGQTTTTTTPPTTPAQASVAPVVKAPKVKGF